MRADAAPRRRWMGKFQLYVFATLLGAMATLILIGIGGARQYHALLLRQHEMFEMSEVHAARLGDMRLSLAQQTAAWERLLLLGPDGPDGQASLKRFRDSETRAARATDALRNHFRQHLGHAGGDLSGSLDALRAEQEAVAGRYREALKRLRIPGADPRTIARDTVGRIDRAATLMLRQISGRIDQHHRERTEAAVRTVNATENVFLAVGLTVAILSCILLLWRLDRIFTRPLAGAVAAARRIARNDLETPVAAGRGEGLRELTTALETMRRSLLEYRTRFANALHQAETARVELDRRVTERTRDLAYCEMQYGLTFERAGVGIAHISVDGNWLQVNDKFCKLLGYEATDLRGTGFQRFSLPADLADERAALDALLDARAESFSGEKRLVRKDGSLIWVSQTVSLVRDETGIPKRFIFVVDDISKRKAAEAALQRSEQRLSTILWATPAAIISVDGDGKICSFNHVAERVFGYAAEEMIGGPIDILVPPDLRHLHRVYMAGYTDTAGKAHEMGSGREITGYRRNGETFPAAASVSRLDLEGEDIFTVILVDITRERAAEEAALAAKREAEIANRTKSTFLANMSHELRTPLNAVIGYSQMLSQQMLGEIDNPKYLEYADIITQSGEHLLELISDVLDVSKIEAGEFKLKETEVATDTLIDECVAIVKERADRGRLSLSWKAKDAPPLVRADRLRLKQVILNLLSNAIKFTPAFGTIQVLAEATDRGLEIRVEDTGCGIAAADIPAALEPFGQVRQSLSSQKEGTGLGLPLACSLMALHGGTLDIESVVGEGTTVTVTLPTERLIARGGGGEASTNIPLSARS